MDVWHKETLKSLWVPGGLLLLAAVVLLQGGFLAASAFAIDFCYWAAFTAGLLLAWRFHASRVVFVLLTLLLAHRALEFFAVGKATAAGPGRIAFEVIAFLLPVNFLILSLAQERGLSLPVITPRLGLLFVESIFVAIICRPGAATSPAIFRVAFVDRHLFHWTQIPQLALLAFLTAFAVVLIRFWLYRRPMEGGLLWSLLAAFAGLQAGGAGRLGSGYFATAGLILVASVVENSYFLAYHDELTALPARRAFNDALVGVVAPYAIAVVDIDHFKSFNDTYGHDTGDEVLRMVAAQLASVAGGAHAYRVGGEEFAIVFPEKSVKEAAPHLESLRLAIEGSRFRVRGTPERRRVTRGSDRRSEKKERVPRKAGHAQHNPPQTSAELSVTVSIGIAEPNARTRAVEEVIQAADQALYRAKRAGRNRVETAGSPRVRGSRLKRSLA